MLSILCVRLTTKVKVGIPESLKVGGYTPPPPQKNKTGSSHLNKDRNYFTYSFGPQFASPLTSFTWAMD